MIIDSNLYNPDAQPRAWLISKINRISPDGIVRVTLAQDTYDQHNDYIERDASGNIIGMWANYFNSNLTPTPVQTDDEPQTGRITATITCTGKPVFKVGGSAKTFTSKYYDDLGNEDSSIITQDWLFFMDDNPVPDGLLGFEITGNKIKVKFLGDDTYIGKIITIKCVSSGISALIDVEIQPL